MSDISDIEDMLRLYESPYNYDLETHPARALTVGVVNEPIGEQQNLEHMPHIQYVTSISLALTQADFSVTPMGDQKQMRVIKEAVNFIGIAPTIRNADLHVCLSAPIHMEAISNVWYPHADYVARAGQGTVLYRIPTMRNLQIYLLPYPSGKSGPYTDSCRIIYGYLPDGLDKLVVR